MSKLTDILRNKALTMAALVGVTVTGCGSPNEKNERDEPQDANAKKEVIDKTVENEKLSEGTVIFGEPISGHVADSYANETDKGAGISMGELISVHVTNSYANERQEEIRHPFETKTVTRAIVENENGGSDTICTEFKINHETGKITATKLDKNKPLVIKAKRGGGR